MTTKTDAVPIIGQHDLNTSAGGRAYIAEFFAKRLRRHDFERYIAERLAADFACALAQYLSDLEATTEQKNAKSKELANMLTSIMNDQTVAMQSALIEWKHGKGAEAGLQWIVNTLMGPGLLPDFDAKHGTNAQFWFDANQSQPMPTCFCGNPSHIGWMGQGFCCNAHYAEAKAKFDAAPAASGGEQES